MLWSNPLRSMMWSAVIKSVWSLLVFFVLLSAFSGSARRTQTLLAKGSVLSSPSCAEQFYRSSCLELSPDCQWCCDARVGRQCFNATEPVAPDDSLVHHSSTESTFFFSTSISEGKTLVASVTSNSGVIQDKDPYCKYDSRLKNKNETCESLCDHAGSNCTACESRIWCVFCVHANASGTDDQRSDTFPSVDLVQGYCQSPQQSCPGAKTIQGCRAVVSLPPPTWLTRVYRTSLICCTVLICSTTLLFSLSGLNVVFKHLRGRLPVWVAYSRDMLERFRHRGEPESDPLLPTDVGDETGEGEVVPTSSGVDHNGSTSTHPVAIGPAIPTVNSGTSRGPDTLTAQAGCTSLSVPPFLEHLDLCCLCLECPAAVTYLPCHHTCCCEQCSNRLRPSTSPSAPPSSPPRRRANTLRCIACPMCRTPVEAMVSLRHVFVGGEGQSTIRHAISA